MIFKSKFNRNQSKVTTIVLHLGQVKIFWGPVSILCITIHEQTETKNLQFVKEDFLDVPPKPCFWNFI